MRTAALVPVSLGPVGQPAWFCWFWSHMAGVLACTTAIRLLVALLRSPQQQVGEEQDWRKLTPDRDQNRVCVWLQFVTAVFILL